MKMEAEKTVLRRCQGCGKTVRIKEVEAELIKLMYESVVCSVGCKATVSSRKNLMKMFLSSIELFCGGCRVFENMMFSDSFYMGLTWTFKPFDNDERQTFTCEDEVVESLRERFGDVYFKADLKNRSVLYVNRYTENGPDEQLGSITVSRPVDVPVLNLHRLLEKGADND